MEPHNKKRFKDDAVTGFNNNVRIILPKIEGTKRNSSLTGSETHSLITSASSITPEMDDDSDLDEMALQEEDEDEERNGRKDGEDESKQNVDDEYHLIKLSATAEKEIRQRAKQTLKKELTRLRYEAAAKKKKREENLKS